jgi:ubiquinone/menaquinone biosynthesis C-methylase UbiE
LLEATGLPYVGLDVSEAMLRESNGGAPKRVVQGAVERLPFADDTFDVVVSCRLLHHVRDRNDLAPLVRELTRVSSRLVVASFWDAASLPAWRRRVGLRRGEGANGRHAVPKEVLQRLFEDSGAAIVGFHHSFRFVSQQTFLVANKRATVKRPASRNVRTIPTLPVPEALGTDGALGQA